MSSPKAEKKVADPTTDPATEPTTTEIARKSALEDMVPEIVTGSMFDLNDLRKLETFDDALVLLGDRLGMPIVDTADVLGDGFTLLTTDDKYTLEGLPMVVLEWQFREGDYGRPFVTVRVMAQHKDGHTGRYLINDGSRGIAEQLAEITKETGRYGGLVAKHGLRQSNYDIELPDGKGGTYTSHATTWYLDTAK